MPPITNRDDPEIIRANLKPFLEGDLLSWHGLPQLSVTSLFAAFGQPQKQETVNMGWYPAQRLTYPMDVPSGGLAAYVRDKRVLLIEALITPSNIILEYLGSPSAIKPHEIIRPGAYVHEYLFCKKGLVLSVAEPFDKNQPLQIIRVRGIQPLERPEQYGPEFHRSVEDETVW